MEKSFPNVDEEKWVLDSSVDHKGKVPLRATTGAWRASLFIIGKTNYIISLFYN